MVTTFFKAILYSVLWEVFGLVVGSVLGVAGFIIVGILTWSSETGQAVGTLAFLLCALAGPFPGCMIALAGRFYTPEDGVRLFLGTFLTAAALALLIGGVILPIANGWIGWLRTIPVFLLLFWTAIHGPPSIYEYFIPPSCGGGSSQPEGTRKVYDKEGNITGYIER